MTTQWTAGQRAALEGILQARRKTLRAQLALHHEGQSRVDHAHAVLVQDADDAPQRATDREVDLALSDLQIQEIAAIERALAHLHEPDFGVCLDCGQAIALDRLRVAPEALRCVPCESRREAAIPRAADAAAG